MVRGMLVVPSDKGEVFSCGESGFACLVFAPAGSHGKLFLYLVSAIVA